MTRVQAVVAVAILIGCAQRPLNAQVVAAAPSRPASHQQLQRDLAAIFSDPAVDHGVWSAEVTSLRDGESLYRSNAFRLLTPASNQKVLTTAAAAERLGWDYRYTTRIYATGPIDKDGAVNGDLVVVGDGDPTINPRHPDRWAVFDEWAKQLAAKGIRQVNGHLIGDDSTFEEPGWAPGWSWDDLAFGYGAAASALQYHENQIELMIGPGREAGSRGVISVSPSGSGITIDHRVTTVAAGEQNRITLHRTPGSTMLTVSGEIAAGSAPVFEYGSVDNPTLVYLNALRMALHRHGVNIERTPLDIDDVRLLPDMTRATVLIEDRSPPLADLVDVTLKWSRNIYAETLLRTMAAETTDKSTAGGIKALEETLNDWGMFREYFLARDGSGLSRYDYLSADALVRVLTHLWRDPKHADSYRSTLPVFGVNGNVANRLKDTPAAGRVWAKTGSMSQVRSLSGYLLTAEGEPLAFAFIVNGFRVPAREIDAVIDKALLRLVEFKHVR